MQLDLNGTDGALLRDLLHDYLPELRREVARTDVRELRRELLQRQDLCERLLEQLDGSLNAKR